MSHEHDLLEGLSPKVIGALEELEELVRTRYPSTTFQVARAADEPESILLWATVDVDDPDEVVDLVLERILEMQVEEHLPVHLVPIRTPARVLAELGAEPRPHGRLVRISYAPPVGADAAP